MNLRERAGLVDTVGSALSRGEHTLTVLPNLIRQLLEEEAWREFETKMGKHIAYDHFEEFVITPPLSGLGANIDLIKRVVGNDPVTLDLLDQALGNHQGERTDLGTNLVNIINEVERPQGDSSMRAIRHLREKRPDLLEQVKAGELSPHKAMVEAGFRHRKVAVRLDDPQSAAKTLLTHASPEFLDELKKLLQ